MTIVYEIIFVLLAYLMGSTPTGLLIVRLFTGKDIREIESGRTGATNTVRAAGLWAGLITWVVDTMKAAVPIWVVRSVFPGSHWVEVGVALAAIAGHIHSIFLLEKDPQGKWRLRGGAGGAPCIGATFAMWPLSAFIIIPIGGFILYFIGYASVGTISVAVMSLLIFSMRAWAGVSPWEYIFYGLGSILLLGWTLRPNFQRLLQGKERIVGFRARRKTG